MLFPIIAALLAVAGVSGTDGDGDVSGAFAGVSAGLFLARSNIGIATVSRRGLTMLPARCRINQHDLKAAGVSDFDGDKKLATGHKSERMVDVYDRKKGRQSHRMKINDLADYFANLEYYAKTNAQYYCFCDRLWPQHDSRVTNLSVRSRESRP
jgi:hypothetical protein